MIENLIDITTRYEGRPNAEELLAQFPSSLTTTTQPTTQKNAQKSA
jgi:hypothetical protein